jgi:hypothetical protein
MDKVKMYTLLLFAVCVFCLAGAAAARAEDFTFTVPVHLKALDKRIKAVAVGCSLDHVTTGFTPEMAPDANGNFDQTVVIKFNSPPDPSKATKYVCFVLLTFDGGICRWQDSTPLNPECAMKGPGTGFVAGNIPSQ